MILQVASFQSAVEGNDIDRLFKIIEKVSNWDYGEREEINITDLSSGVFSNAMGVCSAILPIREFHGYDDYRWKDVEWM